MDGPVRFASVILGIGAVRDADTEADGTADAHASRLSDARANIHSITEADADAAVTRLHAGSNGHTCRICDAIRRGATSLPLLQRRLGLDSRHGWDARIFGGASPGPRRDQHGR